MHYDTTIPTVIGVATAAAVALDVWTRSGSGATLILNGLNRLFLKDVERESRVEAGGFLVAYITGLPCFPFQPSAVEALRYALLLISSKFRPALEVFSTIFGTGKYAMNIQHLPSSIS